MKPLEQVWKENFLWRENIRHMCYNIKYQNWDALGVNSGRERTGKSDHSLWQAITASDFGLNFDWENLSTVFFAEKDLPQKLMSVPPKSVVILDEGAEVLFSRKSMEKTNINLVQLLMVFGSRNIFLIVNCPSWRFIDRYVRLRRIAFLDSVSSYPKTAWVDGQEYRMRVRGFYSTFSANEVRKAAGGGLGGKERPLSNPGYRGHLPQFSKYFPKVWERYCEKKEEFLKFKARGRKIDDVKEKEEEVEF